MTGRTRAEAKGALVTLEAIAWDKRVDPSIDKDAAAQIDKSN